MTRVVAVVGDLMLQSRVVEILRASGYEVATASDPASIGEADLIVADVNEVDPATLTGRGAPVLGFHQHTDPDSKRAAEAAGVKLVVPRSRLVRELPELAERLLSP